MTPDRYTYVARRDLRLGGREIPAGTELAEVRILHADCTPAQFSELIHSGRDRIEIRSPPRTPPPAASENTPAEKPARTTKRTEGGAGA